MRCVGKGLVLLDLSGPLEKQTGRTEGLRLGRHFLDGTFIRTGGKEELPSVFLK